MMREIYDSFILDWAIPLSVGAIIIAMIVNLFIKEEDE
jgi:hypothetical protein